MSIKLNGTAASPGIAIGVAYVLTDKKRKAVEQYELSDEEVDGEIRRFNEALQSSREQLQQASSMLSKVTDPEYASILEAQAMFLDDVALTDATIEEVKETHLNAAFLFERRVSAIVERFHAIEDPLFQARDKDVMDVSCRVLANLGYKTHNNLVLAPDGVIIVAHDIPPSETPTLFTKNIKAFVLDKGSPTSHTAIIAKAVELPAVVALPNATAIVKNGDTLVVDGYNGLLIVNPDTVLLEHYKNQQKVYSAWLKKNKSLSHCEPETKDGYGISIRANIELPEEVKNIAKHGCKGVGLYRTEFLFMNRLDLPTEEEQYRVYKKAIEGVSPDSIVFRTLDIGGDKFFSHVVFAKELNPYLGQRAVRLCMKQPKIFHSQLRAILRASAHGKAKLLIPMISGLDEFLEVKEHLRVVKDELDHQGIPYDKNIPLGTMIEVPAAALVACELAKECDFFSIGTNDLIQYTLAVDRSNESVAHLYEPANPAVLKLINIIVDSAQQIGIPVGVCGEVAADPVYAMLLLGMGVSELSMTAVSAPFVKGFIRAITLKEAKNLAYQVLSQKTIEGVKSAVRSVLRPHLKIIDDAKESIPFAQQCMKSSLL